MPSAPPDPDQLARFRAALARLLSAAGRSQAAPASPIGIAVSGGPDSLALLLLADAALPGGIRAATVDHGLRPEAADEARFVASLCADRGIPHETLPVAIEKQGEGLQAAARAARYAALACWAARHRLAAITTAHHADDQAETLLMRLARGAGIAGLAGVRERVWLHLHPAASPVSFERGRAAAADAGTWVSTSPEPNGGGILVLRPVLSWRKAELVAIVAAAGLTPVDDPANADPQYDRARIRALIRGTDLDPVPLAASAAHLAEAEAALTWTAEREWAVRATATDEEVSLDPVGLPPELARRLVLKAFAALEASVPRGPDLARLIAVLAAGGTATLGGLKASGGPAWRFRRAPPHAAPRRSSTPDNDL